MLLYSESGWLEPLHVVTRGAISTVGASGELPPMSILVAVHTLRMRHWSLEIAVRVTVAARHRLMFAEERKLRPRVAEILKLRDVFPICCVMAGFARRREAPLVRVRVAARAFLEGKPRVFHIRFCRGNRRVALGTGNLRMSSGQCKLRRGVIEARRGFPG